METKKTSSVDPKNYIGKKVQIVSAKMETMKNGPTIRLSSEPIDLVGDDAIVDNKPLIATRILGLAKVGDDIIIPKNGKADKFLADHLVDKTKILGFKEGEEVSVLLGLECTVQKNAKNDFLDIV